MSDWPDAKIRWLALKYIRRAAMAPSTWRNTLLDAAQPEVASRVEWQPGESPLVSYFRSPEHWTVYTTRRIIGVHAGRSVSINPIDIVGHHSGDFKGLRGAGPEVMRLRLADGAEVTFEFETGFPSMGPIYYLRFWDIKHPGLDNMIDPPDPSLNSHGAQEGHGRNRIPPPLNGE